MSILFREPANPAELLALFEFRKEIYAKSDLLKSMSQQNLASEFDCRAFHFVGFADGKPVAYMRMVQAAETPCAEWIRSLNLDLTPKPSDMDFPFEKYSPNKSWNKNFLKSLQGKKIGEAGKLAVDETYRSTDFLKGFIREYMHFCIYRHKFETGFGVCTLTLERFYRQFGFYIPNGAEPFTAEGLPEAVMMQFDSHR